MMLLQLVFLLIGILCSKAQGPFQKFVLRNSNGMEGWFMPFGGTLTHLLFPDKAGVVRDIVLGWDDPTQYRDNQQHPYFGAIVGRYANRIANGSFTLNNFVYHTPLNENSVDTLHGGDVGYDRRIWKVLSYSTSQLVLALEDGDLVEAFPGAVHVQVTYKFTDANEWIINYLAKADDDTVINLSQHTYWNLGGFMNSIGNVLQHVLQIKADHYTPVDSNLIPTGDIVSVDNAPWLDFRAPKPVGKSVPDSGYDYNWVLNNHNLKDSDLECVCLETGIKLEIFTTQPGIQFYSGTYLNGSIPYKNDQASVTPSFYQKYSATVFEAQHFPDSVHHPNFPTTILKKGQVYNHTTVYKLSIVDNFYKKN